MKEEPCSVIVATCLTLDFVYYIENCWTLTEKKKGLVSRRCLLGSLTEQLFFPRDQQQSIVWKRAVYGQKTFCQFDALCVFRHTAAESMNIDKMTRRRINKTLFETELPQVCPLRLGQIQAHVNASSSQRPGTRRNLSSSDHVFDLQRMTLYQIIWRKNRVVRQHTRRHILQADRSFIKWGEALYRRHI